MNKKILSILIMGQILCIIILSSWIFLRNKTKGISINTHKNFLDTYRKYSHQSVSKLKYFYEPIASSVQTCPTDVSWSDKDIKYYINSDSLNNKAVDLNFNKKNIIILGDSFAYGLFVKREANYVSLLEKIVQKKINTNVQIINLGVPGYDIQYSVERFRLRANKYNPQLVIWLLKDDDFSSINEIIEPILEKNKEIFLQKEPLSKLRMIPKNKYMPAWQEQSLIEEVRRIGGQINLNKQQFANLNEIYMYYSGPLLIVGLGLSDEYKSIVSTILKSKKNSFYADLTNIWLNKKAIFPDLHPNELGHQIISVDIFQALVDNKTLLKELSR